jgi:hypothetical protein
MYGSKCNDTGADANANMNGSSSVPILAIYGEGYEVVCTGARREYDND